MVLTIPKPKKHAGKMALALVAGVVLTTGAAAQQYQPPPPPLTPGPCIPTKKDPCDPPPAPPSTSPAAEKFPFPGENSTGSPASPDTPKPATPSDSGQKFPFPGEPDAQKAAPSSSTGDKFPFPGEPPASPSSSSSSSSSSSGSSVESAPDPDADAPLDPGKPLTRTQRRHLPKVEDLDHRELEDLDISRYYLSTGEFKSAYLRAKDAVATMPDDPEAYFALAVAADKMKNTDEAAKNYKKYLELDPEGEHVKAAQRALVALPPAKPATQLPLHHRN